MRAHTITAQPCIKFTFPGLADGEHETAYPTIEITFTHSPGSPAYTPRGEYGPIDPPCPSEVSFVSAKLIDGDGLSPTIQQVQEWGSDYLDGDEGFGLACAEAEDNGGPDPDAAYEQRRDDMEDF